MVKPSLKELLKRTPKSKALFERAKNVYPSGTTRAPYYFYPYPLYFKQSKGCFVWDEDGNKYLDFSNNMGTLILGHRNPLVKAAVQRQLEAFWCGGPTELDVKLGEVLLNAFPMMDKALFTPSGTEAIMKLIRAARAYTGRKRILKATGSYHGSSDYVMQGEGVPDVVGDLTHQFTYNDEESFRTVFHQSKKDLAAVLLEAVLGPAGSVPPTESFIKLVREETEHYGIPLILDEIVTGFRIGRGGISELYRIEPDGVTLGKIIGGGFPIGALLGTEELMRQFQYSTSPFPFIGKSKISHSGTFNAHAISMAAGLATLNQLDEGAYRRLKNQGEQTRRSLSKLCEELKIAHSITGIESIFRLHFSDEEIINYETVLNHSDERKGRIFDILMFVQGIFLAPFHSSFCSVPMGKREHEQFEEAAERALDGIVKLTKSGP